MELIPVTLEDKYSLQSGRIYLSGIQALVLEVDMNWD